jgi:hypothetical protein
MNRTVDGEDVGMKLVTFAFEDIVALAGGEVTCSFSFDSGVIAVEQVSIDLISEFAWKWKVCAFWAFPRGDGQAGHSRDGDVKGRRRSFRRWLFGHGVGCRMDGWRMGVSALVGQS